MKEKQKKEALERMAMLGIHTNAVKEFKLYGKLNLSEGIGALYWLEENEQKIVDEFEARNNAVVYHVIKSFTNFGVMYSLLYVSEYEEEWEQDQEDIREGMALAYVYNADMPDCSEFGTIGLRRSIGGLIRTW